MGMIITCLLTILSFVAYIFIAGMFTVAFRMQHFSLVNIRGFSYSTMEKSSEIQIIDHFMALLWPFVLFIMFAFYIAILIFDFRSKK